MNTNCVNCGAPYTGKLKCEWCKTQSQPDHSKCAPKPTIISGGHEVSIEDYIELRPIHTLIFSSNTKEVHFIEGKIETKLLP